MTVGTQLTLWSARIAFLLYAAALALFLTGRLRVGRLSWTAGLLVYFLHAASAFHFYHHWSQDAAYEQTARQTAEVFGVRSGAGLYWNYAFTAVWALDAIWIWWSYETYRRRPRWIAVAIHSFMAFMFFNATVVFVSGWLRWLGVAVTVALGIIWIRTRAMRKAARIVIR